VRHHNILMKNCKLLCPASREGGSAVTIIIVTIFITIFYNYRIMYLSRYFLCIRDNIFAWHFCNARTFDSPPVYSSFSTDGMIADPEWAASPSAKHAATAFEVMCRRWSPWPSCLHDITAHNYQRVCVVAFTLAYFVHFEWKIRRALAYVQA